MRKKRKKMPENRKNKVKINARILGEKWKKKGLMENKCGTNDPGSDQNSFPFIITHSSTDESLWLWTFLSHRVSELCSLKLLIFLPLEFLVAWTRLYKSPWWSVRQSCNILELLAIFASLLLPIRPRLDCLVSGLVLPFFSRHQRYAACRSC